MGEEKNWSELKTILRESLTLRVTELNTVNVGLHRITDKIRRYEEKVRLMQIGLHQAFVVIKSIDILIKTKKLSDGSRSELGEMKIEFSEKHDELKLSEEELCAAGDTIYNGQRDLFDKRSDLSDLIKHYKYILSDINVYIKGIYKTYSIKKVGAIRKKAAIVTPDNIHCIVELWREYMECRVYRFFSGEENLYLAHYEALECFLGRVFMTRAMAVERLRIEDKDLRKIAENILRERYGFGDESDE